MNNYTGRQIAIFTDVHGLLYPLIAILEDIKKRKIREIYSLGDNIGVGPNPKEVLDLLDNYNIKVINGNSEDYSTLGIEPFSSYFDEIKIKNQKWTKSQLTKKQLNKLNNNKHSYDIIVGGKKIGLCHFANDVRIDFKINNSWSYQKAIKEKFPNPQKQFYYTNSEEQINYINKRSKRNLPIDKGFVSAKKEPLFEGKKIDYYDEIIQGHVHFKFLTYDKKVKIRTIRAAGMAFGKDPLNSASYIIIKEKNIGYDIEEVLIPYDREKTIKSIDNSRIPDKYTINKFINRK